MRRAGQFGQGVLEQGHLSPRQRPQQQRGVQRLARVQPGDKGRQIVADPRLIDQIDCHSLARELRELDRGLGRHGVTRHQMLTHRVAGQGHKPLGHRQRKDLTIGDGGDDFGRLAKAVDDNAQGRFGNVGVVIGGQSLHRRLAALGRQHRGDVARHAVTPGHGSLTHHRTSPNNLDQVVVGEGGRTTDDRQGHAIHIGGQAARDLARHQVRRFQRHRQSPTHQLCSVIGHDRQDLLRRRPIRLIQRHPVDAAAQLVRRRRAVIFRVGLDQTPDVAFRQSGAVGGHSEARKLADGESIVTLSVA